MVTILVSILEAKRRELDHQRRQEPLSALEERVRTLPAPLNFAGCIWGPPIRLIAEVKKASPSRGLLCPDFDPAALATTYAQNGAAAISVLTEVDHFQGSLAHLAAVKAAAQPYGLPILRKDFIFDPYHVYQTRACGADAVLLIVAMLQRSQLKDLLALATSLWLQCLVEVHSEAELETALEAGAELIGVNHRDLRTFEMDTTLALRLRPRIPPDKLVVAESGIRSRADVVALQRAGVSAVLVGEALITAADVGARVRELAGVAAPSLTRP